jgi:hypothetical protein
MSIEAALATPNGGSARGYQAILVPLAAVSTPGYGPTDGQPAEYLYIAALEVNVLNCRDEVRRGVRLRPTGAARRATRYSRPS